jgi:hypothetical protein
MAQNEARLIVIVANATIANFNASAVKIYNAMSGLVRYENIFIIL